MSNVIEVKVPDIGDFKDVPVIEVLVKAGDAIGKDDSMVVLESDKATMEIPSPAAGTVREVRVKVGDKVAEGTLVLLLEAAGHAAEARAPAATQAAPAAATPGAATGANAGRAPVQAASAVQAPAAPAAVQAPAMPPETAPGPAPASPSSAPGAGVVDHESFKRAHASPAVRRFARELGVDLAKVKGSGPHGRILKEDIEGFVKAVMSGAIAAPAAAAVAAPAGSLAGLIAWPKVDFAKFGPIETKPLSRIRKISGANLHRNWVMIPHVTNHEDADITDLETFRVRLNEENAKSGTKVTMLAFLIKACVRALAKFPEFNSSLDGENLVLKQYFHIGFAADTPTGLVVPVVKDADRKGIFDIARETSELAAKARDGKLGPADMQGGTFSISSLGGIGGTSFTPIINAPEVAILGVCRSQKRPVWDEAAGGFSPRLILPLSLSWDHRVIDGASAARFNVYLSQLLADFRRVLL